MTTIDRKTAELVQHELDEAARTIAARYNLKVEKNRCTFSAMSLKVNIEVAVMNEDGVNARYEADFKVYADVFGLRAEWLGQTALMGADCWQLLGVDSKRRKFDTVMKNTATGMVRLFEHAAVARAFQVTHLLEKGPSTFSMALVK